MIRHLLLLKFALLGVLLLGAGCCANRPPVLNCSAQPSTVTVGDTATIQSGAMDPEKKPLNYAWEGTQGIQVGDQLKPQPNGTAILDSTGLELGSYTVGVKVSDKKNEVGCEADVTVVKRKLAPEIVCRQQTASVTEGRSVQLSVEASDGNNDALTYAWSIDGRDAGNNTTSFSFGTAGRAVGSHRVRVTATDVDGMSDDCEIQVTVNRRPNKNPSVSLTLDKNDVFAGTPINARASGSDPDNDPITYAWRVGGATRSERGTSLSIGTGGLGAGRHEVSVEVRDDRGGSARDMKAFSIREKAVIAFSGARLDNVAKAQLDEIALKLQQNPRLRATLTGHTDDRGSEKNNLKVGQRRADKVADYLVKEHQIDAGRIESKSAGESQPASDNETAEGRKENRRVEVVLYVP